MSWDVLVLNFKNRPLPIENVREEHLSEIGTASQVQKKINTFLENIDWTDPNWGIFEGDGFSFEFNVSEDENETFMIHVRGGGDCIQTLLMFSVPNDWTLYDISEGEYINAETPSQVGWKKWQAYRNQVTKTYDSDESDQKRKNKPPSLGRD